MSSPILISKPLHNHQQCLTNSNPFSGQSSPCSLLESVLNTDVSTPIVSQTLGVFKQIDSNNQASKQTITSLSVMRSDSQSKSLQKKTKINSPFVLKPIKLEKEKPLLREKFPEQKEKSIINLRETTPAVSHSIIINIPIGSRDKENSEEKHAKAKNFAKSRITYFIVGFCFYILMNILGLLSEMKIAHYSWFLFLLEGIFLVILCRKIAKSKFRSLCPRKKMIITIEILNSACYIAYFTIALLRVYNIYDSLHLAIMPICCIILLLLFIYLNWLSSSPFTDICWHMIDLTNWIQIALISLKIEKVGINWFCALSILLAVLFVSGLITVFRCIVWIFGTLRRLCYNTNFNKGKIINFWYNLSLITSIILAALVFSVGCKLNSNEILPLKLIFIIGATYSLLLVIITLVIKETLIKEISEKVLPKIDKKVFDLRKPEFGFLKKKSPTYFSPASIDKAFQRAAKEEFKLAQQMKFIFLKTKVSPRTNRPFGKSKHNKLEIEEIRTKSHSSSFVILPCDQNKDNLSSESKKLNNQMDPKHYISSYSCNDIDNYNMSKKILHEIKKSEEEKCLLCLDTEPDAVIMECGHGGICHKCAIKIWKKSNKCYMCRSKISSVLRIKQLRNSDVFKVKNKIIKTRSMKSWL